MVAAAAVNPWSQQQLKICPGIHLLLNYWSREPRVARLASFFLEAPGRRERQEISWEEQEVVFFPLLVFLTDLPSCSGPHPSRANLPSVSVSYLGGSSRDSPEPVRGSCAGRNIWVGVPKDGRSRLRICPSCWAGGHLLSCHPSPWASGRSFRVLGGRPRWSRWWSRFTRTMLTRRGLCARSACCRSSPTPTSSGRSLSRSPGGHVAVGTFSFLDPFQADLTLHLGNHPIFPFL